VLIRSEESHTTDGLLSAAMLLVGSPSSPSRRLRASVGALSCCGWGEGLPNHNPAPRGGGWHQHLEMFRERKRAPELALRSLCCPVIEEIAAIPARTPTIELVPRSCRAQVRLGGSARHSGQMSASRQEARGETVTRTVHSREVGPTRPAPCSAVSLLPRRSGRLASGQRANACARGWDITTCGPLPLLHLVDRLDGLKIRERGPAVSSVWLSPNSGWHCARGSARLARYGTPCRSTAMSGISKPGPDACNPQID
jgi:hypothetical protein